MKVLELCLFSFEECIWAGQEVVGRADCSDGSSNGILNEEGEERSEKEDSEKLQEGFRTCHLVGIQFQWIQECSD